jgi:hypothetical protein
MRSLPELAGRLGNRASEQVWHVLPSVRPDLLADPRLVLTGASAASVHGSSLDDPVAVDAYVRADRLDAVTDEYALLVDPGGRVRLRVIDVHVWPFTVERHAWKPVVALDLLTDAGSDRARLAGEELL